jgi:hypothetical protein
MQRSDEKPSRHEPSQGSSKRQKSAPLPPLPLHDNSIDVREHMQTALLCSNRLFQEQGISRLIASYHKDLLQQDDVLKRIDFIFKRPLSTATTEEWAMELIQYMTYYVKTEKIYHKALGALEEMVSTMPPSACAPIIDSGLDVAMAGAALHPGITTLSSMVKFCRHISLSPEMVDRIFDLRGEVVLADYLWFLFRMRIEGGDTHGFSDDMYRSILQSLIASLQSRPDGRHFGLATKLRQALEELNGQEYFYEEEYLCEQEYGDDDETDEDFDDGYDNGDWFADHSAYDPRYQY